MDSDFPEIKKIPRIPEELLKILPTGQIVLFIGAGVSCLVGYPTWDTLAKRILSALAEDNDIMSFSWADVDAISLLSPRHKISIAIDICRKNKKNISELLKKTLVQTVNDKSEIYKLIVSIPAVFVTTNYDSCLTDTFVAGETMLIDPKPSNEKEVIPTTQKKRRSIYKRNEITIEKLTSQDVVFHLHGAIKGDENSLVLTTRDYVENYRDKNIIEFLDHLFDKYSVIFIGYGLSEEEILEYVVRKRKSMDEIRHFRLFPLFSHQKRLYQHLFEYYKNQCNVKLIPYLIDEKEHHQLEDVLKGWLPVLKSRIRPQGFIQKTKLILDQVL